MIAGRWMRGEVYPDAGLIGWWTWHAVILVGEDEQAWTPAARTYTSKAGAIAAMKRWRKSGTERGMVEMCSVPEMDDTHIQTGEVLGRLPPGAARSRP